MLRPLGEGRPRIHPTAFVSEGAVLVGAVEVGEGVGIWPGVVLRADEGPLRLGPFTNVQDNSVVVAPPGGMEIGAYTTLGHAVVCRARRVGSLCLLGNGAVVGKGAILGDRCIVAAGAVVPEGTVVPEGSFVAGVPAEVKGPVTERHLERIRATAERYAQKAREYRQAGLGLRIE